MTEDGSSVTEKVFSMTEHGSSATEKVFSVTEHGSSATEKVFSVADPTRWIAHKIPIPPHDGACARELGRSALEKTP